MSTIELGVHAFTPPSKEVKDAALREHTDKIEKVAYSIYERRVLKATEDPYEKTMLDQVSPDVLAVRDYLLATSLVNCGSNVGLELLHQDLLRLQAKNQKPR